MTHPPITYRFTTHQEDNDMPTAPRSGGAPDRGFRAAPVTAARPGLTPREESGPIAWWRTARRTSCAPRRTTCAV